jgi:D-glycero-alpha-D-manno-heptose-7-phosphate kinase
VSSGAVVEASAPARVDLAGGTLDLWPLHVLHPGSATVNVAIDRRARVRVRRGDRGFLLRGEEGFELHGDSAAALLAEPRAALVGSLLLALEILEPLEIEVTSGVPFGSGLGGSSAIAVALMGALEAHTTRPLGGVDRVDFVRDVETRVLGRPAGVQDYFPPLEGGLHVIRFLPGQTRAARRDVDAALWARHLILYDTGASHSSGMNNWEVFKSRLEGDTAVEGALEGVRRAAVAMAEAAEAEDFEAMGRALSQEWEARRRLASVVSTPTIEAAIAAATRAGAWAGKACGAGGGGCVVFLSPADRRDAVAEALAGVGRGRVLPVQVENRGLTVEG